MSLYTSIPHDIGLRAAEHFLAKDPLPNSLQINFILESLVFLKHNYFESEGSHYLTSPWHSYGEQFCPQLCQPHDGFLGEHAPCSWPPFFRPGNILKPIHWHSNYLAWHRQWYFKGFLDLEPCHENGTTYAKKINKPTAGNSFIHYNSRHYPRWGNIAHSQFCRLHRNCTRDSNEANSQLLAQNFLVKGYPDALINDAIEQLSQTTYRTMY